MDKADNSVIYKKGDVVGNYNLSKEGKLEINNLPIGTYNLEETKTIDGLVINKNKKKEMSFNNSSLLRSYM